MTIFSSKPYFVIIYFCQLLLRDTSSFVCQNDVSSLKFVFCFSVVKYANTMKIKSNFSEKGKINCQKRLDIYKYTYYFIFTLLRYAASQNKLHKLLLIKHDMANPSTLELKV